MIDTSFLPQTGEPVTLPDGSPATVAWCSGWTWPLGLPRPTRYYAQALTPAGRLTDPVAVYPTDLGGGRRWIAERRQPVRYAEHMVAMTTADGTAAAETALCGEHDLPLNRDSLAAQADTDVTGPWVDATGNDALACQVCGAVTADLPDSSYDAEELDPTAPWNVGGDS